MTQLMRKKSSQTALWRKWCVKFPVRLLSDGNEFPVRLLNDGNDAYNDRLHYDGNDAWNVHQTALWRNWCV